MDLGWLSSALLLYPKSQILRRGAALPSRRVFSSLRSRWQTPWGGEWVWVGGEVETHA